MNGEILATILALAALGQSFPAAPPATAPARSFPAARQAFFEGDFDRARKLYDALASEDPVAAACGQSAIDFEISDYSKGIERLRAFETRGANIPEWHVCLAALLDAVGNYDQAIDHNRKALALVPEHVRARFQLGCVLESLGRTKEAIEAYRPFDEIMTTGSLPKEAEALTCLGTGFLRFSMLTRHPQLARRIKHVLTEVYQEAFDHVDLSYFPARLAAAGLLLGEHNLGEAEADYEMILTRNPKVASAHVGLGYVNLNSWKLSQAQARAEEALKLAPNLAAAHLLLASILRLERKYDRAKAHVEKILAINPNSIEALAVLAAAHLCEGDAAAARQTEARIEQINPASAVQHFTIGQWLSNDRQRDAAEARMLRAIELDSSWVAPRTELGRILLEKGEEVRARKVLEEAFEIDRFNSETHEVLSLLDTLEKFIQVETEHFLIKFSGGRDAVLEPYLTDVLEGFYREVCDEFSYQPPGRTTVEVFPDHMGFSVRISGRPFVSTIGACSGPVIAMAAPFESAFGKFNWAEVLRHEFAHTVTIAATKGRIPRWFTEGLSVYLETPRQSWNQMTRMSIRTNSDKLFSLETIDWGFSRPKDPHDVGDAYAQSEWIVEYIVEQFGKRAIGRMLKKFGEGAKQKDVFTSVLGVDPGAFDRDFRKWATERVRRWRLPESENNEPEWIELNMAEWGRSPECLAELAEAWWRWGAYHRAEDAAEEVLRLDEAHPDALFVMGACKTGRMLAERSDAGRREFARDAKPFLQKLVKSAPSHFKAMQHLGWAEQELGNLEAALQWLEKYSARYPDDPEPVRRMAIIHGGLDNADEQIRHLKRLNSLVRHEPWVAMELGQIHFEQKKYRDAARWYLEAIHTDPYSADSHSALGETLYRLGELDKAEREYRAVIVLRPNDARGPEGLSRVFRARGDRAKAEEFAEESRTIRRRIAGSQPTKP